MTTLAEKPRNDVYVRVQNILRAGLRTEEITDDVALDWELLPDGTERLAGVEVLAARGVEVDGLDVVTGRAHGTSPDTGQARVPCLAATFEGSGCRGTITDGQCSEQDDHHPTPGMLPYDGPGAESS